VVCLATARPTRGSMAAGQDLRCPGPQIALNELGLSENMKPRAGGFVADVLGLPRTA
jgi:hypothetical protein